MPPIVDMDQFNRLNCSTLCTSFLRYTNIADRYSTTIPQSSENFSENLSSYLFSKSRNNHCRWFFSRDQLWIFRGKQGIEKIIKELLP